MRSYFKKSWIVPIIFVLILSLITILLVSREAGAGCISFRLSEDNFEVDNADGLTNRVFEPTLTIDNDCGAAKNINIKFTAIEGEDWGRTDQVYAHIFTQSSRPSKNSKGPSYSVQVEEGESKFYPSIDANWSALADVYTFQCRVTNKDDGNEFSETEVMVTVPDFNEIDIAFQDSKVDKEKKIGPGKITEYYVIVTNMGNIYHEEVTVEVKNDYPDNFTMVKVDVPKDYIDPQFHREEDSYMYISVQIQATAERGEGNFEFDIIVMTPENDLPEDRIKFVTPKLEISSVIDDDPPPIDDGGEEGEIEWLRVIGPLGGAVGVMIGLLYFFVLKKEEEGAPGWGDEDGWGADEWGEDAYEPSAFAEEFEAPITEPTRPRPRPAPRAAPRPRPAPAAAPRAAAPAHVKCPKCKASIKVSNPKRPLTIGCPRCSTKFTLKGKPGAAPAPRPRPAPAAAPRTAGPAHVKCPKCKTGIKVSNPKRPLTIGCPKCSTKFTLKGKPGAAPAPRPRPAPAAQRKPSLISCPRCSTKFKVSNPKRPLKVACPKCKTSLNLK